MLDRFYEKYLPTKDKLHRMRQGISSSLAKDLVERTYQVFNTLYYLFVPFVGASLFYFDIIKDCCLAAIFQLALADLTQREYREGRKGRGDVRERVRLQQYTSYFW